MSATVKAPKKRFELRFGAMQDALALQLQAHGLAYNEKDLKRLQGDLDAIIRLKVQGYLSEFTESKLFGELRERIERQVNRYNQ